MERVRVAKVMRAGKGRDIQGLIVGSLRVVVALGLEFYLSKLLYQYAPTSTSLSTPRMNITFLVIYLKRLSVCREKTWASFITRCSYPPDIRCKLPVWQWLCEPTTSRMRNLAFTIQTGPGAIFRPQSLLMSGSRYRR